MKTKAVQNALKTGIKDEEERIRIAALTGMIRHDPHKSLWAVDEVLKTGTTREQQAAIVAMSSIEGRDFDSHLKSLMQILLAGTLEPAIQLDVLLAAKQRDVSELKEMVTRFETQREQQSDPVKKYAITLEGGDPERGYDVFFGRSAASCRRCHKVQDSGGEVGPDLSAIGKEKERSLSAGSDREPERQNRQGVRDHDSDHRQRQGHHGDREAGGRRVGRGDATRWHPSQCRQG